MLEEENTEKQYIDIAKELIKESINLHTKRDIELDRTTNNEKINFTLPIKFSNDKNKCATLPLDIIIDQYKGKIHLCPIFSEISLFEILNDNIPSKFDVIEEARKKYNPRIYIEELPLEHEILRDYNELRNIEITSNTLTKGNNNKYSNSFKDAILYIDKQLTISRYNNPMLGYIKTNTYAFSVKPKWIIKGKTYNTFDGTMHLYLAYITHIHPDLYLSQNFLYIQLKNRINSFDIKMPDIMGCTSKLYKFTGQLNERESR